MSRKPTQKRHGRPPSEGETKRAHSEGFVERPAPAKRSSDVVENDGAAHRADGDPSYRVGRGHPPKHSQFKPGRSGNPKGRRKRSRNLRTIVTEHLEQDMRIRVGGRLRRKTTAEVFVLTLINRALTGDLKAVTAFLVLLRQVGYGLDQGESAADPLLAGDFEAIIADYMANKALDGEKNVEPKTPQADPAPGGTPQEKPKG